MKMDDFSAQCRELRRLLRERGLIGMTSADLRLVTANHQLVRDRYHSLDMNQGSFCVNDSDLDEVIDIAIGEFDADGIGMLTQVTHRDNLDQPVVNWSRSYHLADFHLNPQNYVCLAAYVHGRRLRNPDVAAHIDEVAASYHQEQARIANPQTPDPNFVATPKEKRICVKCGQPVDARNDCLELQIATHDLRHQVVPLLTYFMSHCHLLPEGVCPGSPSRAQYVEGQPRDSRSEHAYNQENEQLYREAYALIQTRSRV